MPLLGRHKSSAATGASSSSSSSPPATGADNRPASMAANSRQQQQQQLCESPLFGIRRQLPTISSPSPSPSPASSSKSDGGSNKNSNSLVSKKQTGNGANKQQLEGANSTGLSSIPQQITRQQINYAFTIMDSNKDGQVDVRDLSQMLSNLGILIDEAILAHIMKNTVSKRGDHRISEAEFLDWISHFIQIRSESPPIGRQANRRATSSKTAVRATRSSTAGTSLVAQPSESPRARRGSGSGLALMRSLSSSSASSSSSADKKHQQQQQQPEHSQSCDRSNQSSSKQNLQHQSSTDSLEAKNDLRAAFCVFDLDGDGYITLDEVRAGLKLLGESWSQLELQRVFSKCSSNQNSSDLTKQRISIDDFVQLLL